jgi:hypothetical protein
MPGYWLEFVLDWSFFGFSFTFLVLSLVGRVLRLSSHSFLMTKRRNETTTDLGLGIPCSFSHLICISQLGQGGRHSDFLGLRTGRSGMGGGFVLLGAFSGVRAGLGLDWDHGMGEGHDSISWDAISR